MKMIKLYARCFWICECVCVWEASQPASQSVNQSCSSISQPGWPNTHKLNKQTNMNSQMAMKKIKTKQKKKREKRNENENENKREEKKIEYVWKKKLQIPNSTHYELS